ILQYLLLRTLAEASENATIKKELLSPWQLFVVVQRLIQNKSPQNDDVVRNVLLRDLQKHCCRNLSKLQFIFLLPCINYLSFLREEDPLISSFPSRFEEGGVLEGKYDDLDKKIVSILDTDLTLLKMGNDAVAQSSNPYARVQRHQVEMYVIKLLQHYSDESRLCQSVLEFLFAQSEEIWKNICQSDNDDKCWQVMCIAFQNDFSMWNKFIERLQIVNIFEDDKVRSTFFKNFKVNSTFQQLVTTSPEHLFNFFGFIQTQKNIWKSDDDLLTTIERYIDNIFYCEKIMSCLIDILWNVLSILFFVCRVHANKKFTNVFFEVSLEDKSISDKVIDLTTQLLENIRTIREQRQSESEPSLKVWIQLFNHKINHQNQQKIDKWNELLTKSLKTWFNEDYFEESTPTNCYHRKALWLLTESRLGLLPDSCRNEFEKCLESKSEHFEFNNECWSDKDRNQLGLCIGNPPWNLIKWDWFLKLIFKDSIQQEIPSSDVNVDEKEEKTSRHPPVVNESISIQMELLIGQLRQCISYAKWKDILINHQSMDILKQKWSFVQNTMTRLMKDMKENKINITLCEFLKADENETYMKELSDSFDQQAWSSTIEKFNKFKKWEADLQQLLSMKYLEDVPSDLEALHEFLKDPKNCHLSDAELQFGNELKLLECFQDEFQAMITREKNQAFRIKWNNCKAQFQNGKCLQMTVQPNQLKLTPDLEKQLSHFFEKTDKKIVRRIMTAWRHVANKESRIQAQPSKLIKDYLQNTYFFSEELNFFPHQFFTWDYCITGYNFVVSRYKKLETKDINSTPTVTIDFMEVFEHTNSQWEEGAKVTFLKKESARETYSIKKKKKCNFVQGTETIRKHHKAKDKIINDEKWEILQEKLDMSKQLIEDNANMSIEDAIRNYNWCVEYFGDIKECVHIFDLIVNNEQKIQTIASNEVFIKSGIFESALKKLEKCDTEKFCQLVKPLRDINQILQEKIWKTDFKEICILAKTILSIVKENQTFAIQLGQCLEVDFPALFRAMEQDDEVFGTNELICEEIGHSIDLLKLGLTSEEKKDIEIIISQFEICKDIYAIRVDYWEKGGISFRDKLVLPANDPISIFQSQKNKWIKN
ncbi:hypothetical protein RFI_19495, partial [Reticulomyxa filosa]